MAMEEDCGTAWIVIVYHFRGKAQRVSHLASPIWVTGMWLLQQGGTGTKLKLWAFMKEDFLAWIWGLHYQARFSYFCRPLRKPSHCVALAWPKSFSFYCVLSETSAVMPRLFPDLVWLQEAKAKMWLCRLYFPFGYMTLATVVLNFIGLPNADELFS